MNTKASSRHEAIVTGTGKRETVVITNTKVNKDNTKQHYMAMLLYQSSNKCDRTVDSWAELSGATLGAPARMFSITLEELVQTQNRCKIK
jgi:predicted AlkP superfamily pyrophosphatase or phosphodiesterase